MNSASNETPSGYQHTQVAAWDEDRDGSLNVYLRPFRPPDMAGSPRQLSKKGELIYLNHGAHVSQQTISSRLIPRRTLLQQGT